MRCRRREDATRRLAPSVLGLFGLLLTVSAASGGAADPGRDEGTADALAVERASREEGSTLENGLASERLERERRSDDEAFALVPHRINYLVPASYASGIDDSPYRRFSDRFADGLRELEVQFQLSVKARLNPKDLFFPNDSLAVGFTLESWWQLYAESISSPFRETNYRPEVFYLAPTRFTPFGGRVLLGAGMSLLPDAYAAPFVASGELARLLPGARGPEIDVHASFAPRRSAIPAVRLFIDLLVAECERVGARPERAPEGASRRDESPRIALLGGRRPPAVALDPKAAFARAPAPAAPLAVPS